MNFKALISIFSLLISSISALAVLNFPMNHRVEPGSEMTIRLSGDGIASGDHVRVELWDNQDDEDVNAAILGEELKVQHDGSVKLSIPSHFPKTKNAFFRIYYKCHNAVSPRFTIKPSKNCVDNKPTHKPTHTPTAHPTPIVIYQPSAKPVVTGGAVNIAVGGGSGSGSGAGPIVAPIITGSATTAIRPTSSARSSSIMSTSTSTSSAAVAKFSAGSIAVAMAVAFAMLF